MPLDGVTCKVALHGLVSLVQTPRYTDWLLVHRAVCLFAAQLSLVLTAVHVPV